jgi:hypothetical protein
MTNMLNHAMENAVAEAEHSDLNTGETSGSISKEGPIDIEHIPVKDDPRSWSLVRKVTDSDRFRVWRLNLHLVSRTLVWF